MIDTHCHLTYDGLYERIDEVLQHAHEAGVDRMITVGTSPDDARKASKLAETYNHILFTVGLHPHYTESWRDRDGVMAVMRELAALPSCVALGEMGLDRHYPEPSIDTQRTALHWQLEVAKELTHLPIIIHNREATEDTLSVLRESGIAPSRFVFHCFTGTAGELDAILDFGAMVSFTGIVTFKSAADLAKASDAVPLDRLMIETDSPYLTPEPHRKVRPNEPCYVPHVAAFLAARRNMSTEAFTQRVDTNAERFFRLVR